MTAPSPRRRRRLLSSLVGAAGIVAFGVGALLAALAEGSPVSTPPLGPAPSSSSTAADQQSLDGQGTDGDQDTVARSSSGSTRIELVPLPAIERDLLPDQLPRIVVIATAGELVAIDATSRTAWTLDQIAPQGQGTRERFDRVQLVGDGYVYYDRLRANGLGATFRIPIEVPADGRVRPPELLTPTVSPSVQFDPESGRLRLATLARPTRPGVVITDLDEPAASRTIRATPPERQGTVPVLRHPSWAPRGVGDGKLVVEWALSTGDQHLALVDADRADFLDRDDHVSDIHPPTGQWHLPAWPGDRLRVAATSPDSPPSLLSVNPANERDHEVVMTGDRLIHHEYDQSGAHFIGVTDIGEIRWRSTGTSGTLELDQVALAAEDLPLTSMLSGPPIAADW